MSKKTAAAVLLEYPAPLQSRSLKALGNAGGFSGSRLWRYRTKAGEFCLRRWPDEMSHSKALTMHLVLRHVQHQGCDFIAAPLANEAGQTLTVFDDGLWEVTPWIDGQPLLVTDPTGARVERACENLARFHLAAASYQPLAHGPSPGLKERLEQLLSWRRHDLDVARHLLAVHHWPEFAERANAAIQLFQLSAAHIEGELRRAVVFDVPLQFCIRDARAEHFLFTEQALGIIDFGALRVESVAGDVARLLGTMGDLQDKREIALAAYDKVRPLNENERALLDVFQHSGIALAAMNWMRWIVLEGRQFESWPDVFARLDALLNQWAASLRS